MVTGKANTVPLIYWIYTILQLKKLGCGFIAFYGAEPLIEMEKLAEAIGFSEKMGIPTTVITSGVVPGFLSKLQLLHKEGLRSLTMSYDIQPYDKFSRTKSNVAIESLEYFKSLGHTRDVAVVVTLTRNNYKKLADTIRMLSHKGIWTLFDFIHPDRGQPGSKCSSTDNKKLFFTEKDKKDLVQVVDELIYLKRQGFLLHASLSFLKDIKSQDYWYKHDWNCLTSNLWGFPSWVTIDCDGKVYACDDFQPQYSPEIYGWEIADKWLDFVSEHKRLVASLCPGCAWSSHIDAHLIKVGIENISDYTHSRK
jgi:MoaA/NifB/PqqE/SkfB family radical SAM enzyme